VSFQFFHADDIVEATATMSPSKATATMSPSEELYFAMLRVGWQAKRHKIPGPLAHTMIDTAVNSLEAWRRDEKSAIRFAAGVLAGPINHRATTGQLPGPVAEACWRLIDVMEYLADLDGAR
ncbi:MAG: hypothetical protein AB2556_25220, partial [Candidatus Thiodiazotropha sp.]